MALHTGRVSGVVGTCRLIPRRAFRVEKHREFALLENNGVDLKILYRESGVRVRSPLRPMSYVKYQSAIEVAALHKRCILAEQLFQL